MFMTVKQGLRLLTVSTALLLSACSSQQGGSGSPETSQVGTSSGVQSMSTGATSPAGGGTGSTAGIDPCSLLDKEVLGLYGTTVGPVDTPSGGGRPCTYEKQVVNASDGTLAIGVNVRDSQALGDVNDQGKGKTTGHMNGSGRAAVQVPAVGGCTIALAVGQSSRVDVVVTMTKDEQACTIAQKVADSVDSKLPKG